MKRVNVCIFTATAVLLLATTLVYLISAKLFTVIVEVQGFRSYIKKCFWFVFILDFSILTII